MVSHKITVIVLASKSCSPPPVQLPQHMCHQCGSLDINQRLRSAPDSKKRNFSAKKIANLLRKRTTPVVSAISWIFNSGHVCVQNVYTYVHIHICNHAVTFIMLDNVYVYVHKYLYLYISICTYIFISVHNHMHIYIYILVYIYIY